MKKILITGANSYIGTSFENYIKKKRREDGLAGFGFLHVMIAAYIRLVSQNPQ